MYRNTFILVSLLAVFAALVIGVNIGRRGSLSQAPTPTPGPAPASPQLLSFNDATCGISLKYPSNLTKLDSATGSAVFLDPKNPQAGLVVICQKDIPRPPLSADKIESFQIGSVSAKLYHDTTAKDGKPVDSLIFANPKTKLDVFISGLGDTFQQVIQTVEILP